MTRESPLGFRWLHSWRSSLIFENSVRYKSRRIETRRQAIQAEIDARRSAAERNRLGQFATPNRLAVEIAKYVKTLLGRKNVDIRFADPSIGSGSFFSAVLTVFGRDRIAKAVGIELDPAFFDVARVLWADQGLDVVRGDFTRIVASPSCLPDFLYVEAML